MVIAVETMCRYANQSLFSQGLAGVAIRLHLAQLAVRLLGLNAFFTHGLMGTAFGFPAAAFVARWVCSHPTAFSRYASGEPILNRAV